RARSKQNSKRSLAWRSAVGILTGCARSRASRHRGEAAREKTNGAAACVAGGNWKPLASGGSPPDGVTRSAWYHDSRRRQRRMPERPAAQQGGGRTTGPDLALSARGWASP